MEQITLELKRNSFKKIGFTNGCFDLIHQGHVSYLKEARKRCDLLILDLIVTHQLEKLKVKKGQF